MNYFTKKSANSTKDSSQNFWGLFSISVCKIYFSFVKIFWIQKDWENSIFYWLPQLKIAMHL